MSEGASHGPGSHCTFALLSRSNIFIPYFVYVYYNIFFAKHSHNDYVILDISGIY